MDLLDTKNSLEALKRAQSLVGTSKGRLDDDFYRTPEHATKSLLKMETFPFKVWEPACGDGAISKVLIANGYENQVVSTDLIDRGYGNWGPGRDFFLMYDAPDGCRSIVTNPPYRVKSNGKTYRVEDWVERAFLFTTIEKVALLLKTTAIAGQERSKIFKACGLCRMLQFRGRLTMVRAGGKQDNSGMIDFAWFIFQRGYHGDPYIKWI